MHADKVIRCGVQVNLRDSYIFVAEEMLQVPQIQAVMQTMSCETMAELIRVNSIPKSGAEGGFLYDSADRPCR